MMPRSRGPRPTRTRAATVTAAACLATAVLAGSIAADIRSDDADPPPFAMAQESPPPDPVFLPLLGPDAMTGLAPTAEHLPEAPELSRISDIALAPGGEILAVADVFQGLRLFDVSDSRAPRELSRLGAFTTYNPNLVRQRRGLNALTIAGHHVYASPAFNYVSAFDIRDPSRPYQVSAPATPSMAEPHSLHAVPAWDRLFAVHSPYDEVTVLDISRVSPPVYVDEWTQPEGCQQGSGFNRLFFHRERLLLVTDCRLYVWSHDAETQAVSRSAWPLTVFGWDAALSSELDQLYVVGVGGGLEVIDVSDIDRPRQVRVMDPDAFPFNAIELNDRGVGLVYTDVGARAIDASDPTALRIGDRAPRGLPDGRHLVYDVIMDGPTAYALVDNAGDDWLWIFEIGDDLDVSLLSKTR